MFILISYDIREPKRLQRVAKLMERYGNRVQYSVFECLLSPRERQELESRLARLIQPAEDSVRFYRLCEHCADEIKIMGVGKVSQDDDFFIA